VGRADQTLDLRLRFPPAFAGAVFRASDKESLSAPFLWSIMRLESGYNPGARSRAGALGLLQLMSPTASRLAGRTVPVDSLTDPVLNVELGARYLRRLAREFGDLRPVAAAYNGGEDAVRAEQLCQSLAQRYHFLEARGIAEWPDGTAATHYRFVHAMYHHVVYEQISAGRRIQLHKLMGLRIEKIWGGRAREEAAALAMVSLHIGLVADSVDLVSEWERRRANT